MGRILGERDVLDLRRSCGAAAARVVSGRTSLGIHALACAVISIAGAGCERGSGGPTPAPVAVPTSARVDFNGQVLPLFATPNLFAPSTLACNAAGCHSGASPASGLDLSSYSSLMASNGGADVSFGQGSSSPVVTRITANRMPPGTLPSWAEAHIPTPAGVPEGVPVNGPFLPTLANIDARDANGVTVTGVQVVDVVRAWIDSGALDSGTGGAGAAPFNVSRNGRTFSFTFEDHVLPVFNTDNVFFAGSLACSAVGCHFSSTDSRSANRLDMTSYAGIMAGANDLLPGTGPLYANVPTLTAVPLVFPGNSAQSLLVNRLTQNRMPWTIPFTAPKNGPANQVQTISSWIDQGAFLPQNPTMTVMFSTDILPLFTQPGMLFPGSPACNTAGCHTGKGAAHNLDMSSYDGILLGTQAGQGAIVFPGNGADSLLMHRLRQNRMPYGIPTTNPGGYSLTNTAQTNPDTYEPGFSPQQMTLNDWVAAGAPNGPYANAQNVGIDANGFPTSPALAVSTPANLTFSSNIVAVFTTPWYAGALACNNAACHVGSKNPSDPSWRQLNLVSYTALMAATGYTGAPIVVKGNTNDGIILSRVHDNRMPFGTMPNWAEAAAAASTVNARPNGVPEGLPVDGPNGAYRKIVTWINEGARYDNGNFKVAFPPAAPSGGGGGGGGGSSAPAVSFSGKVMPILQGNCSCHLNGQASGGQKWDDYAHALAGNPSLSPVPASAHGPVVIPGNGAGSLMYLKVSQSSPPVGAQMPFGGPYLSVSDQLAIKAWIDEGAPNN